MNSLIAAAWLFFSQPEKPKDQFASAHASVTRQLLDPRSAMFRQDRLQPNGDVCGEVNAHNSFGGYAGFKQYIFIRKKNAAAISLERPDFKRFVATSHGGYLNTETRLMLDAVDDACRFQKLWLLSCPSSDRTAVSSAKQLDAMCSMLTIRSLREKIDRINP